MRRSGFTIALLCTLALPASAAARDVQVGPFIGGPPASARPATLGIGAKGALLRITWQSWNGPTAKGEGIYDIAGFAGEPGTGYRARTGLLFSGKRTCGSENVYTTLTLALSKPIGGESTQRITNFTRCASTAAASTRRCGDLSRTAGAGLVIQDVRATRTTCAIARRVASTWRGRAGCGRLPADGPTACSRILGYACARIAGSGEAQVFRCRNGSKSVRFDVGS